MHPQLTSLHFHGISWPIGSYGLLLTIALGVGAGLALWRGTRAGLEEGALISSIALAIAGGFVGAFACSIVVRFFQLGSLSAALAQPGIVFYGALLGGALGLAVGARSFGLPLPAAMDALLPALPIAHAIGRIGCFFGGCCYGAPSELPWAVHYPGETLARHPWPLYEAAVLCALAALFWRAQVATKLTSTSSCSADAFVVARHFQRSSFSAQVASDPANAAATRRETVGRPIARERGAHTQRVPAMLRHHGSGQRALLYVLCYACARLALEPLRGDAVRGTFGMFSTSQLISLLVIAVCLYAYSTKTHAPVSGQ